MKSYRLRCFFLGCLYGRYYEIMSGNVLYKGMHRAIIISDICCLQVTSHWLALLEKLLCATCNMF